VPTGTLAMLAHRLGKVSSSKTAAERGSLQKYSIPTKTSPSFRITLSTAFLSAANSADTELTNTRNDMSGIGQKDDTSHPGWPQLEAAVGKNGRPDAIEEQVNRRGFRPPGTKWPSYDRHVYLCML
jgi:hypothetical protein